ncbi:caspase family protein [Rhizobium calliandrae]|uniref:Caspase family protein n=1 Tax=Rhizobium calliandrae TaxID=1312182 RepID=A0ABT7KMJ6_9HYPH|nr:caspase family protein [Rhizobium calliandrae]MDL2409158.1 caspase family protein [Rhizobium calliandrae]
MPEQNKDFALVVGFNHYPFYADGGNLRGAIADACKFADWLKDKQSGGGLPDANCKLITSTGDPLAPDVQQIEDALVEIWQLANAVGGGRRFYLFFSGHGHSFDTVGQQLPDVALCLPRWSRELPNKSISANHLMGWVQRCMPFSEIVMFFDCCRSRILKSRAQDTAGGCPTAREGYQDTKIVSIFAAEHEQRAFEGAQDADTEVRGYFTTALLAGLKGAAAPAGEDITQFALWDYLQAEVPRLAKVDGRQQVPKRGMQLPPERLVFGSPSPLGPAPGPAAAASNFEIRFKGWRNGSIRLRDADSKVLREGPASSGPWPVMFKYEVNLLEHVETGDTMSIFFRPGMEGQHATF